MGKQRRRGRGEGSITRRKDGLYQASVSLGKRADGTRHREFCYGRSKAEVLAKLQELRRTQRPATPTGSISFAEYANQWLESKRASLAPGSLRRYRYHLAHLVQHLGQEPMASITPLRVERLYGQLAAAGCSAAEIGACAQRLGSICKAARRLGLLAENPVPDVPRPKIIRREIVPFNLDQVARLLEAARGDRHFAAYVLAIDSGIREGELLALLWPDLDFERGIVRIERQLQKVDGQLVVKALKTRRSRRTIRLAQATLDALAFHRREALRLGQIAAPVFCNCKGGHLWPEEFASRRFKRLLRRAGLPDIRFHDLRHTCATLLLLMGEKTLVVSERLGHSKPSITTDVYQHVLEGMQDQAAAKMQQVLGAALEGPVAEKIG